MPANKSRRTAKNKEYYKSQNSKTDVNNKRKLEKYVRFNPNDEIAAESFKRRIKKSKFSKK